MSPCQNTGTTCEYVRSKSIQCLFGTRSSTCRVSCCHAILIRAHILALLDNSSSIVHRGRPILLEFAFRPEDLFRVAELLIDGLIQYEKAIEPRDT